MKSWHSYFINQYLWGTWYILNLKRNVFFPLWQSFASLALLRCMMIRIHWALDNKKVMGAINFHAPSIPLAHNELPSIHFPIDFLENSKNPVQPASFPLQKFSLSCTAIALYWIKSFKYLILFSLASYNMIHPSDFLISKDKETETLIEEEGHVWAT